MDRVRRVGAAALAVLLLVGSSAVPAGAADFVGNLRDKIATSIPIVAGLLAMVAAVVVGGVAYYGSNNTGKWVGKFLVGTLFVLAATLGADLLPALRDFFGIGR